MVPLDRVKRTATQAAALALPGAVSIWGPAKRGWRPSNGQNLVVATLARAPSAKAPERLQEDTPTSLLWTMAAPVAETRVGLCAGGVTFGADVPSGGTAEDTRDALLAVLEEDIGEGRTLADALLPDVTVASVGTDSIRLTTSQLGRLYYPNAFGPSASITIEASTPSEVRTGRAVGVLEFEAFAAGPGIVASAMLGELELALGGYDVKTVSAQTGVTLGRNALGDIVPLDTLAGPTWESRATMRCLVALRTYRAVQVDYIENVRFSRLRVSDAAGNDAGPPEYES